MDLRSDNIDAIDITALRQLLTQRGGAVWVSLDGRALGSAHQPGVIYVPMPTGLQGQQTSILGLTRHLCVQEVRAAPSQVPDGLSSPAQG